MTFYITKTNRPNTYKKKKIINNILGEISVVYFEIPANVLPSFVFSILIPAYSVKFFFSNYHKKNKADENHPRAFIELNAYLFQ